ncbi:RNA polymerase sigma-B factor [compost metagenome]
MNTENKDYFNPYLDMSLEKCIESNINLVRYCVNRFKFLLSENILDYEDLVSEGCIGLIKAYRRYNPEAHSGAAFSTYASHWINGCLHLFARDFSPGLKFPRTAKQNSRRITKMGLEYHTPEQVADKLDITVKGAQMALDYLSLKIVSSLDAPIIHLGEEIACLGDLIRDPMDLEGEISNRQVLQEFLSTLSPRDAKIFELSEIKGMTQSDIGDLLGVGQVTVSRAIIRIYNEAIKYGKSKGLSLGEIHIMQEIKPRKKRAHKGVVQGNKELAMKLILDTDKAPAEIAELSGCNINSVYAWCRKRNTKSYKLPKHGDNSESPPLFVSESQSLFYKEELGVKY